MKLSQFFIISGSTASFSEFCKKLDRETCYTKSLCQWNGSYCDGKNTLMLSEIDKQSIKSKYEKALGKTMVLPEAGTDWDRHGTVYASNILGDGFGKECPVEVPWCERSPCNGHMSELNTDSEACFRQRGCCFDSVLYLYRDGIGESFAEGVPVCYKAINNPIFDEITKTGYDFNSIDEKANQILRDYQSNVGKKETLKKMGCSPSDDDVFGRIGFIHVLSKGNHRLRNAITQIDGYHEFIDFVSPLCGWTDISSYECFLIGCCWNEKSERCGGPLEKIYSDRIDAYLTALETKNDFKDESCEITEEPYPTNIQLPIVTTSLPMQTPGPPNFGPVMPGPWSSNVMINIRNRRSFFLQLDNGYTPTQSGVNVESTCQARDNSSRCMDSCVTDVFNYAKKPHMEALCKARGCCFDNAQYDNITQDKDYVKKHCPYESYASGLYDIGLFPSIRDSVKGCCDVSLCVNNQPPKIVTTAAPSTSRSRSIPLRPFDNPQAVQWTAWSMWSACTGNSRTRTRQSSPYKFDEETDDCNIGYPEWLNVDNIINIVNG